MLVAVRRPISRLALVPVLSRHQLTGCRSESSAGSAGPLQGLRVLDFTRILAGPSCTQILGDMGAEIIKLERPGEGDDTRAFAPPFLPKNDAGDLSHISAYFAGANRNKSSVTLNYTKPEGQEIARRLLKGCDVLVENFKTGTLDKYGLGYSDLKKEFPRLVFCSITGFGQTGPYKDRPGYDALIQAMGGIMSITGEPEGQPMKVGLSVCDLVAGMHGVMGILAALRHVSVSGKGVFDSSGYQGAARRHLHAGRHDGLAREPGHELLGHEKSSAEVGQQPPEHRPLPGDARI